MGSEMCIRDRESKVEALKDGARHELASLDAMGGAIAAIGYMKGQLVQSNAERLGRIEQGETVVVGVNKYQAGEPSPLMTGDGGITVVDPSVEAEQIARLDAWRAARDTAAAQRALADLRSASQAGENIMPASIACARAGVTTGEWAAQMRAVHGEYRCLLYTSPSPRDLSTSRMPSSA